MRTYLFSLRGLLVATGLAIASQCANAQEKSGPGLITPFVASEAKIPVQIFNAPQTGSKNFGSSNKASSRTQATGVATIADGQVTGVRVTNQGTYSGTKFHWSGGISVIDVKIDVSFLGGGGSGASGSVELGSYQYDVNGTYATGWFVKGVQITNPGSGYTSPPTVTFVAKP